MGNMSFGDELRVHSRRGTQLAVVVSPLGILDWITSPDHTTLVSHYEANVRASGSETTIKTKYLGKPGASNSTQVFSNIAGWLNELPAGSYTVKVVAVNGNGSTASNVSNTFDVPLIPQ